MALRADPDAWGARPVFAYGFDDLSRAQLELLDALSAAGPVTVAVTFADRRALAPRAKLVGVLRDLGAEITEELPFEDDYTPSATLRHLDRALFEPGSERVAVDDGLVLLESAGARGEAEAVGVEIARLLRSGYEPDEIVIVLRHPDPAGRLLAAVLREMGIPVALESSVGLAATQVGGALIALCRAATDESAVSALLAHLRLDPALAPGAVDTVEARIRRGDATTVTEAVEHWDSPPRHLQRAARGRDRGAAPARPRAQRARAGRGAASRTGTACGCRRGAVLGPRAARGGRRRRAADRACRTRRPARLRGPGPGGRDRGDRVRVGAAVARAGHGPGADPRSLPGAGGPGAGPLLPLAPGRRLPKCRAAGPAALRGPPSRHRQSRPAAHGPRRRGALPVPLLRLAPDGSPVPELAGMRRGRHGAGALTLPRRGLRPARPRPRRRRRAATKARPGARRARGRGGDERA